MLTKVHQEPDLEHDNPNLKDDLVKAFCKQKQKKITSHWKRKSC